MPVRDTIEAVGDIFAGTVASAKSVTQGNLVALVVASGNLQDASDAASIRIVGVAQESAVAGATVLYKRGKFWLANSTTSAIAKTAIGSTCVCEDAVTVAADTTNDIVVGTVLAVDATKGVLVEI